MKPRPLKDSYFVDVNNGERFTYHKNIKSAVEWLKEKSWIENYIGNERIVKWEDVLKAFPDVIKVKEDNGGKNDE